MKAVDTNILARLILQDDARQAALAATVMREPVWVSVSVWLELGWVLGKRLKLERAIVADALSTLLTMVSVHVSDRDGIAWAIDRFRDGADWADMIHLIANRDISECFVTFDRSIERIACDPPLPIETLA